MKNKKILLSLIIIIPIFFIGFYTGHKIYQPEIHNYKEYGGRFFNIEGTNKKSIKVDERTGIFITYGQSNSANHGLVSLNNYPNVYQFFLGDVYEYKNPSLGTTGLRDSVWGLVGKKLVDQNIFSQVVFANTGWGGRSINELKTGHFLDYFIYTYNQLFNHFNRVDGILYHQGESDNNPDKINLYYANFYEFVKTLNDNGIKVPIYLSQASYCTPALPVNKSLTDIQRKLITDHDYIFEGPNTDLLTDTKFRFDQCHFSEEGNDKFADMWVESLKINFKK